MKVADGATPTHNPFDETCWASGLRENLTSRSYGEGLETGRARIQAPRQSLTRQLLFKEWKSYANLHAFDTTKVAIVEGLIWTAIAAAALKRFLAHMTQLLAEVPMSTRKVAMCAVHVLGDIVRAVQRREVAELYTALEKAVIYLACHAQRAHPARDRQTGRSQLGLEPCFEHDDMLELVEAA